MDDISLLDPDTRSLVEKYLLGPAEVAGQALGGLGSQSINGLAGLAGGLYRAGQGAFRGDSPRKILQDSTDAAADIMDAEPVHMPEMSTAGQQTISRDMAPAIMDFMRSRAGQATAKTAHQIASVGRKGIDAATAAAAGRVAPEVQGAVAALAEAAPQELLRPFGAAARTIGDIPKFAEEAAGAGAASFAVPKEFVGHAPIDQLIDHGINPGDYHPKYIKGLLTAIASGTDPQIAAEVAQRALKMHPEVFGPFGNYKPPKSVMSAMDEYQANMKAAGDLIKRGAVPDSAPADDALHFVHYSNLSDPNVTLDPKFYGTGIKGLEANRGAMPTISLYPHDINPKDVEHGLESKTKYRVSVPKDKLYDATKDEKGLIEQATDYPSFTLDDNGKMVPEGDGILDMNAFEQAVKKAGYMGYHTPGASGILRGQARLFQPVDATRADRGGAQFRRDILGNVHQSLMDNGGFTYNPNTFGLTDKGYAVGVYPHHAKVLDQAGPNDLEDFLASRSRVFEHDPDAQMGGWFDKDSGKTYLDVTKVKPTEQEALDLARQFNQKAIYDIGGGREIPNPHYSPTEDTQGQMTEGMRHWIGASPLIDSKGNPVKAYHGTSATPFKAFRDDDYGGHFFAEKPEVTNTYISMSPEVYRQSDHDIPPAHMIPAYLQSQKHAFIQGHGAEWRNIHKRGVPADIAKYATFSPYGETSTDVLVNAARKAGYTGVTFRDIVDTSQALHGDPTDNIHVVFKPNQIKSAVGNSGAYSLDDPDITKKAGGQVFAKGGAVKQIAKLIAKYGDAAVLHDTAVPEDAVETFLKSRYGKVAPPPESLAGVTVGAPVPPSELEQYLRPPPRKPVKYKAGEPTVDPVQRVAFPGIYKPANQAVAEASARVGPEDPLLHRLFGVNRADLTDIAMSRQGNELGVLPGAKPNATGAKSALGVMNPRNEQRLIDVLAAAKQDPKLRDMIGWYTADPLYERFRQIYGDDMSPREFDLFRHLTGMASPGSDVGTELNRGTAAYWLNKQGRFPDFMKYAGQPTEARGADFPDDMRQVMGHPYHRTAQGEPMLQYLNSGQLQMKSPKVPPYIQAFGSPETGFQTDLPVGDAHWSRGVGLADTRDWRYSEGEQKVPGSSVSTPEAQTLAPWWRSKVADQVGLESVPAQALLWGAYAPQTGVETTIGAPKLEILATQIGKVATRLGVSPETARDMVITGQTGAF